MSTFNDNNNCLSGYFSMWGDGGSRNRHDLPTGPSSPLSAQIGTRHPWLKGKDGHCPAWEQS